MRRITRAREAKGWSKAELARVSHMNATTISQIESGRWTPYDGQLKKLARALGVPESEAHLLLDDTPAPECRAPLEQCHVGKET
jgi:transcriptional regulator with XRE-family HTH domain